jgi:hypothetical protein
MLPGSNKRNNEPIQIDLQNKWLLLLSASSMCCPVQGQKKREAMCRKKETQSVYMHMVVVYII